MTMHTHQHIRQIRHEELLFRLQTIRQRRLVAALEYKDIALAKNIKLSEKLKEQWDKQNQRSQKLLDDISEKLIAFEKSINKQVEIAHKLSLTEGGIL